MATFTLLDAAKLGTDAGKTSRLVEATADAAPEVFTIAVIPSRGTSYYSAKRTGLPTVAFRRANEGQTVTKSTFTLELKEMFRLESIYEVDRAIAHAYAGGWERFLDIEGQGHVRSALTTIGQQMFYGTASDALGFTGLKQLLPKGAAIVVDAGGTTAATASSVYAAKIGAEHVSFAINEGTPLVPSKPISQQKRLSDGTMLPIYCGGVGIWIGLQVANENCIGRVCNVTADAGKGVTDALIASLLQKFPKGFKPDFLYMSARSLAQLRQSRSTNTQGPEEWSNGVRVIECASINDTDAIET